MLKEVISNARKQIKPCNLNLLTRNRGAKNGGNSHLKEVELGFGSEGGVF